MKCSNERFTGVNLHKLDVQVGDARWTRSRNTCATTRATDSMARVLWRKPWTLAKACEYSACKPHHSTDRGDRRKFRSQTSDNMDRWKAQMGRITEEKRRKKIREEKESKERSAGVRKSRKVAKHLCFSNDLWLWRFEKSRLAKAAGAEMKNCTQL